MRIDPELLNPIAFFYTKEEDAKKGLDPIGTGFFVWIADDDYTKTHVYLITNEHIVRASAPLHVVRSGAESLPVTHLDWMPHPQGDDIAVCYFGCDVHPPFARTTLAVDRFLKREQVEKDEWVGIGDECLMIGCFPPHSGTAQNLPVVRFGNVSMMPSEPVHVDDRDFDQECFLVEMRSRGGFSGSPVFLLPSLQFDRRLPISFDATKDETVGICCGHLQEWRAIKWRDPSDPQRFMESKVEENSGMAMVIPAWKIRDFLLSDELKAMRKKAEEKIKERLGGGSRRASAALDAATEARHPGPEPERLVISGDWQDAVKRALKEQGKRKP